MNEQNRNDQAQRQSPTRSRNWESVSGVMRGGKEKEWPAKNGENEGNEREVNNEWTTPRSKAGEFYSIRHNSND